MSAASIQPTPGFALPLYRVEGFPGGWHGVCNAQDFNCLSFPGQPGAKFTTLEQATEICAQWNKAPT